MNISLLEFSVLVHEFEFLLFNFVTGHSEKDVENDSSVPFDASYKDWDLDF